MPPPPYPELSLKKVQFIMLIDDESRYMPPPFDRAMQFLSTQLEILIFENSLM
jgi:hypothetical protein